ncbi:hypothetical protein, partial [Streptomyces bikiniensis]|uniref:hypothetical protein n=1 Tax=Streptomyces bikiniensis TaxID=1896 RepID=UPI001ADFD667
MTAPSSAVARAGDAHDGVRTTPVRPRQRWTRGSAPRRTGVTAEAGGGRCRGRGRPPPAAP